MLITGPEMHIRAGLQDGSPHGQKENAQARANTQAVKGPSGGAKEAPEVSRTLHVGPARMDKVFCVISRLAYIMFGPTEHY